MLRTAAFAAVLLISLSGGNSYVEDVSREQMEFSGAYELEENLPDDAERLLDRLGIELTDEGIGNITPDEAIDVIAEITAEQAASPVRVCIAAVGFAILSAIGSSMTEESRLSRSYKSITAAASVLTVCVPVAGFIDIAADAISSMCRFSSVLVPVLSGLAYISGHTASATAYSGITLATVEGITLTCGSVMVPMLRILLGISAAGALCGSFDFGRLISAMEKSARWLLGIMGVLLSGTMSMSAVAASAADTAAAKGTRFVISGVVPVVGGTISEAIGTITNCVGVVRSTVGSFGIIAGLFIILPSVTLAVLWLWGLNIASWAANALGAEQPSSVIRSLASVVSLTLGLMVFTAVVLTCSAALIISLRSV